MEEEIEILQSIYYDEIINIDLKCDNPFIEIQMYPPDTESNENKRTLRFDLFVSFTKLYPDEIPEFQFKNVRGIREDDVKKIHEKIILIANQNKGNQMLFEIIQFIKDELSSLGSIPKETKCCICLDEFSDSDENQFINLDCYHYYHKVCLIKHVKYVRLDIEVEKNEALKNRIKWKERFVSCPVCRETINQTILDDLDSFYQNCATDEQKNIINNFKSESVHELSSIVISNKMRKQQHEMKILFEKQKLRGGIIDLKEKEQIISISNSNQQIQEQNNLLNLNNITLS